MDRPTLADELLLIAYDDEEGSAIAGAPALDYGLAAALLIELALADRVEFAGGRLTVRDTTPTGEPFADRALATIAREEHPRKPGEWLQRLSRTLREDLLASLVNARVLRREQGRVLWVFPVTRYPAGDPAPEHAARAAMRQAVHQGPVDARTAALCGLVEATGLARAVGLPAERLKAVADERWAADAVRKAVAEVQAAVMVAISAATVATTVSTMPGSA
ncbi:GPP34 family phosphoprotein [Dactylosporangium sucinum]|uniref:GPP34 family phosphoprotein n=1 Tax=Dactylosporangium sucinum TaxID=1424081 RepID=A0A917U1H7_9ACTN|nr:GPP34 family phosphoprotein [Dactylosporangium sucinum]GGM50895.1 hypothetical protein GCM10007977_060840 [Dactylosporangium sucinum]